MQNLTSKILCILVTGRAYAPYAPCLSTPLHMTPTILGSTVGYPSDSLASCIGLKSFDFLANRTNGRAYATVLRLSVCLSVVCDVMYCG